MSKHRPAVQSTALPTVPARNFNDYSEHIHRLLREGYPARTVNVVVDRHDGQVDIFDLADYFTDNDQPINRMTLDKLMDGREVEVFVRNGIDPTEGHHKDIGWEDAHEDLFRDLCEQQLDEWAKANGMKVAEVSYV